MDLEERIEFVHYEGRVDLPHLHIGYNSVVHGYVRLGRNVRIGNSSYIVSENSKVIIGDNVEIGDLNIIKERDHDPENKGLDIIIKDNTITKSNVSIENGIVVGERNYLGTGTNLGRKIVIGNDNRFNRGSHIARNTTIGNDNIFYNCTIGSAPEGQERKRDEIQDTEVIIGDRNTFREYLAINRGSHSRGANGITKLGDNNLVLGKVQIGHDCNIGRKVVIVSEGGLAGHVVVCDNAWISGQAGVTQFVHVGNYSFIGAASKVEGNVLPYSRVYGNPAVYRGINTERLERMFPDDEERKKVFHELKQAFKIIEDKSIPDKNLAEKLRELNSSYANEIADFIENINLKEKARILRFKRGR